MPQFTAPMCQKLLAMQLASTSFHTRPILPDLNPIEHMWSIAKYRVSRMPRASNLDALREQTKNAWDEIPMGVVDGLWLLWKRGGLVYSVKRDGILVSSFPQSFKLLAM